MHIPTYTYQLEAISQNIVILDSCNRQLASSERPHLKCPITITFVISTILSIKTNRYFTKKIMPQPLYLVLVLLQTYILTSIQLMYRASYSFLGLPLCTCSCILSIASLIQSIQTGTKFCPCKGMNSFIFHLCTMLLVDYSNAHLVKKYL